MRTSRLKTLLRRFGVDREGAAAVEFALILPFLLLLYMGTVEASSLMTVDRRIAVISGAMGDLVARWDPDGAAMTSDDITDFFRASEGIIMPYPTTGLQQVVSFVRVNADGSTEVAWSRGYNGGTQRTAGQPYPEIPSNLRNLASGGFIVASETTYPYRPVLGLVFRDELSLYSESFYLPRFGRPIGAPS
jgi:Flp pilus assembly protein TadG